MTQHSNNAQSIIDIALASTGPIALGEATVAVVIPDGGSLELVDTIARDEKHQEHPNRARGGFVVHDAASFNAYLGKHATAATEVWADVQRSQIVGVIDAHAGANSNAGWGEHKVLYSVKPTVAWEAWTSRNGRLLSQSDFAELIEDRAVDIIRPTAADMLELAQTFQATIGVNFESSKLLSSGERQLEYRETVEAKAGRKGTLEIPKDFDLGIIPFEGAQPTKVTARFRYRINDGVLLVGFRLNRPEDVIRDAFESVVKQVEAGVDVPVFRGVSAA